jgi:5-methylcytosine-specific restriction endonuclease McrA
MPQQRIPDIDFDHFVLGQIKSLFDKNKICINSQYQRGDIWEGTQPAELINSIFSRYSIGVLVLYMNDSDQYEILDGQQRLITIHKYVNDQLDLKKIGIKKYSELTDKERISIDAYCVYYLQLKSHDRDTKEEDIVQTFLRLQEGTPLNKAEKINAYRGKFKDTFRQITDENNIFKLLGGNVRFRHRLLCAELLLLELDGNFIDHVYPGLDISTLKAALRKYSENISNSKITFFKGNLDYLYFSLNYLLTAITSRDLIPFYLLISYLRKNKADNSKLKNELANFAEDFLQKVNMFSVYENKPPAGMSKADFKKYMGYKTEGRKATSSESIKYRVKFLIDEFKKFQPHINKDQKRLFDKEQKRILFFKQKGICPECSKKIDFRVDGSAHHVIAHKSGGSTGSLDNAVLLHEHCHIKLERKLSDKEALKNAKL